MEIHVRLQDSLWYYSQLFDVPLILIEKSNPQVVPQQLTVGQTIRIPGYQIEQYTVQQNDSAWTIAMAKSIQLDSLNLVNPAIDLNFLQIGVKHHIVPSKTLLFYSNSSRLKIDFSAIIC